MGFKSTGQRKFLFAMDKDKQKGSNVTLSNPNSLSPGLPTTQGVPPAPKMGLPKPTTSPSVIPPLPGLPKPARFEKTKKFFKKSF